MPKYLGETEILDLTDTPFSGFDSTDWALYFLANYGQIDGEHHKSWVIDQAARILHGTPVTVFLATWDDGQKEYRVKLSRPSDEYLEFVKEYEGDDDEWSLGIAP